MKLAGVSFRSICSYQMDRMVLLVLPFIVEGRMFCEKAKLPLEVGKWRHGLLHMDATVVENKPVTLSEGQVYVYENYFPNYTIKYVHVDNLAVRSCGASASIKSGGIGFSSVLIILHADAFHEIRSVVDIWGTKNSEVRTLKKRLPPPDNMKSLYLFKDYRIVSHNSGMDIKMPKTMGSVH